MAYALGLAFVAVPILEIAIFIQVGSLIGLWPTLLIVLLTAVAGTALVRSQGFRTLASARRTMDGGGLPVRELFDGLCILVGGILLLTPGFFTDALGLLLLLPPVRDGLRGFVARHVEISTAGQGAARGNAWPGAAGGPFDPGPDFGSEPSPDSPWGRGRDPDRSGGARGPVIDADFTEVDPRTPGADTNGRTDGSGGGPPDSRPP